jgi:hypothetical protein
MAETAQKLHKMALLLVKQIVLKVGRKKLHKICSPKRISQSKVYAMLKRHLQISGSQNFCNFSEHAL